MLVAGARPGGGGDGGGGGGGAGQALVVPDAEDCADLPPALAASTASVYVVPHVKDEKVLDVEVVLPLLVPFRNVSYDVAPLDAVQLNVRLVCPALTDRPVGAAGGGGGGAAVTGLAAVPASRPRNVAMTISSPIRSARLRTTTRASRFRIPFTPRCP